MSQLLCREWIGLGVGQHEIFFVDWIGLGQEKVTHVQLWLSYTARSCRIACQIWERGSINSAASDVCVLDCDGGGVARQNIKDSNHCRWLQPLIYRRRRPCRPKHVSECVDCGVDTLGESFERVSIKCHDVSRDRVWWRHVYVCVCVASQGTCRQYIAQTMRLFCFTCPRPLPPPLPPSVTPTKTVSTQYTLHLNWTTTL